MGEPLGFGILGPLAVTAGHGPVTIAGARQRTVLALLLLDPGRIVATDTLVDVLWDGAPPASARTQVAIVVAGLRKSLGRPGTAGGEGREGGDHEVIVTAHPGYRLRTDGHTVDSAVFTALVADAEAAVRAGRPEEAERAYTEALALWRGRALAGVRGRPVEAEAARWDEVRLSVQEAATEVRLALGRHRELLPELAARVREHPLRERARQQLILAQYRSGRRAEAMAGFREARRRLIDELGVQPGPALRELNEAMLRDDPVLLPGPSADPGTAPVPAPTAAAAPPPARRGLPRGLPVPSELPPEAAGFAGRTEELAALDSLLAPHPDGAGPVPAVGLVTGVAGVGKTGLAVRWAHRVRDRFPDGTLFADLRGYSDEHALTTADDVLGRFLRALGVESDAVPSGSEDRVALYRSLLAGRRVLIVLDNVRTFAQLRPLLPGSAGCTVLATSRDQLEELVTWPQAARVRLGLLPRPESVELLERVVGRARLQDAPEDVARLAELCDRLPLALRIAGARLASKPHWTVRHLVTRLADERRRLDELSRGESQVRASFALSYRYLPPDAARLCRLLGLLAVPDFAAWAGAALLDTGVAEAERLVEHLVDTQFLEAVGIDAAGQLRYRFHDLMRLYAGELARDEEPEAARDAARERFFLTFLGIADEARRREYGGPFAVIRGSSPSPDLDPALLDELLAVPLDWYEAERLSLVAAVDQAARTGLAGLSWELAAATGTLFTARNYVEDWRRCSGTALEAARAAGDRRGEAAMERELGGVELRLSRLDASARHYGRALELFEAEGDDFGRAMVLNGLALVDRHRGGYELAEHRLRDALAVFRAVGDLSCEGFALQSLAQCALDLERPEEAVALGQEAVRICESIGGTLRGIAQARYRLACAHLAVGRPETAAVEFTRALAIVRERSDLLGLAYTLLGFAEARHRAGAVDEAERTLEEALEVAGRTWSPIVEAKVRLYLGELHHEAGRPVPARAQLGAALDLFRGIDAPPWVERAAAALARTGEACPDPAEARPDTVTARPDPATARPDPAAVQPDPAAV
ncbi:BTAD domain-containing putative transcriptional regulator [Kitasatospora purpeofusca]|uniref:AfsR/SARP family transcriptional regulator n=1 Tax=Kitasatospora purpeofusca TaxID=67352 RepID=UPI0036C254FE